MINCAYCIWHIGHTVFNDDTRYFFIAPPSKDSIILYVIKCQTSLSHSRLKICRKSSSIRASSVTCVCLFFFNICLYWLFIRLHWVLVVTLGTFWLQHAGSSSPTRDQTRAFCIGSDTGPPGKSPSDMHLVDVQQVIAEWGSQLSFFPGSWAACPIGDRCHYQPGFFSNPCDFEF